MRYVSLKIILDKILRDSIFNGLTMDSAIDYCISFFSYVDVSELYVDKYAELTLQNFRCELPVDLVSINQVLFNNIPARYATDTFHSFYNDMGAGSNFDPNKSIRVSADFSFKIQGDYLYSSIEHGTVRLSYKAIPIDEEGFPLIPDNPTLHRALKANIELEYLRILWRNSKIPDKVYQDAQQLYAFAVGAYETDARKLDLSKSEVIANLNTILPRRSEFINRYRNLGTVENWKSR